MKTLRYTEDELILAWRQTHGLAPQPETINSEFDNHLNAQIRTMIRSWYSSLLRSAPVERLPQLDLTNQIQDIVSIEPNAVIIPLPRQGYQPVSIKMMGWSEPVTQFNAPGSPVHLRQSDVWRRSSVHDPAVIQNHSFLIVYGLKDFSLPTPAEMKTAGTADRAAPNPASRVESLIMTAWPADGSYQFDADDFPTLDEHLAFLPI